MTILAKVIADSVSPDGIRLTTMQLRYPRFIHSEVMTHRMFSRNASSSRAIPVSKLLADVQRDPAMPLFWGRNQSGMQARVEVDKWNQEAATKAWLEALNNAVQSAHLLSFKCGIHKQIANRLLEPFSHINVLVTSTEWANFYALRRHADAQPEMKALADVMWEAQQASEPQKLVPGEWHLPYINDDDQARCSTETMIKLCVARCARVSHLTHEGKKPNIDEDLNLYERLVGSVPLHASPAEHCCTPDDKIPMYIGDLEGKWRHPNQHGNLTGWRQHRKMLLNEYAQDR